MHHPSPPPFPDPSTWERTVHLAGDASARQYRRVWTADGGTRVVVDYPPPVRARFTTDLEVLGWCRDRGLAVPGVIAVDPGLGRAVLEDLGDEDGEAVLARTPAGGRPKLLDRMVAPLETLAGLTVAELPDWNPPLDRARLRWELAGFELWYLRHYRSRTPAPRLGRWLDRLAERIADHPRRVCHRDYHLNNLLVAADGSLGVIDIQDILVGPDTYDVVSLVWERAAPDLLSDAERDAVLAGWARATGAGPGWRERAAEVRLQRGLKVLGTFARFIVAGDERYRPWLDTLARTVAGLLEPAGAPVGSTALLVD